MLRNKLLLMIANFLHGAIDAEAFSYEFPSMLAEVCEKLEQEDTAFAEEMDEMPELCASFDPHATGEPDTIGEAELRAKVTEIYLNVMQNQIRKVS